MTVVGKVSRARGVARGVVTPRRLSAFRSARTTRKGQPVCAYVRGARNLGVGTGMGVTGQRAWRQPAWAGLRHPSSIPCCKRAGACSDLGVVRAR